MTTKIRLSVLSALVLSLVAGPLAAPVLAKNNNGASQGATLGACTRTPGCTYSNGIGHSPKSKTWFICAHGRCYQT